MIKLPSEIKKDLIKSVSGISKDDFHFYPDTTKEAVKSKLIGFSTFKEYQNQIELELKKIDGNLGESQKSIEILNQIKDANKKIKLSNGYWVQLNQLNDQKNENFKLLSK